MSHHVTALAHAMTPLVNHQANVAKRYMDGLHTVTGLSGNVLARRPFFVFWFMGQISRYAPFLSLFGVVITKITCRALSLWDCDHSLTIALDVCKAFLPPIEYLTGLWPCGGQ